MRDFSLVQVRELDVTGLANYVESQNLQSGYNLEVRDCTRVPAKERVRSGLYD